MLVSVTHWTLQVSRGFPNGREVTDTIDVEPNVRRSAAEIQAEHGKAVRAREKYYGFFR